jgi:opacity protein-like surface antigen
MMKRLRLLLPVALLALPAAAQDWSLGVATGPFVFGKFAERTKLANVGNPDQASTTLKLSAATRPGLLIDVERNLDDRFAVRLQSTFTEAPLKLKSDSGGGVALDSGKIDVTTFTLPLLIRINPHGSFRFHVTGGPAYAAYHVKQEFSSASAPPFHGTRGRLGGMAGAGLEWSWTKRVSVEGEIIDIVTSSPLEKSDFIAPSSVRIPKAQNEHATIGVRYHF